MKQHIRNISEYVDLYRDDRTGIAWIENGKTGGGHTCHPSIDATGSVIGMKQNGGWKQSDRCIKTAGAIHNIDRFVVTDDLDQIAADECRCQACIERKSK